MTTTEVSSERSQLLTQITFAFKFGGALGLIFGLIHFSGYFTVEATDTRLADAIVNTFFGIMALICWRMLIGRKLLVVAVWLISILVSLVYSYAIGRGFNVPTTIFGVITLALFSILWKRGELT